MSGKCALVAGVTGIAGQSVARNLVEQGFKVYGLSRRSRGVHLEQLEKVSVRLLAVARRAVASSTRRRATAAVSATSCTSSTSLSPALQALTVFVSQVDQIHQPQRVHPGCRFTPSSSRANLEPEALVDPFFLFFLPRLRRCPASP